jgi:ABC-type uncharacterized transport system permease subunit
MLRFRIERAAAPLWLLALLPVLSVLVTFLLVSVLIIAAGANPLSALVELVIVPLTRTSARADILMMATPLIITGVAVAVAFTAGYYNIGAEGQLFAGAIAAAWVGIHSEGLPPFAAIPLMLIGGFMAGMLWSLVPALLKV